MPTYTFNDIVYTYTVGNPSASVTNFVTGITNATISSTISPTGPIYNVTSIGDSAFEFCGTLTSVTIPSSVTSIGEFAFQFCTSLASVNIPNSVTIIKYQSFFGCTSLASVTIPSSVTTIELAAFRNCSNLNLVYFLQQLALPTIQTGAFTDISVSSVGKYYSTITDTTQITPPIFNSISSMTFPTLTSITPFNGVLNTLSVISYTDLVTNGNEDVGNTPYVFIVNAVSSGSLSIGTTQVNATLWNASTNKTIAEGTNAYWTPPGGGGLANAFSVVVQDSFGTLSSPNTQVQVNLQAPPEPPPYPCFLEGTQILCFENNQEIYRPVESLQKGDLVKTIYNGYMPICMMGTTTLYNPGNDYRVANRIYKCPKEKYPALFEDLYITGCHSILVPSMTDDQWENTKAVNGNVFVTDNHFRLIACADEKAEPYNKEGFMNIYHIALDHHDICMNYGIYANGLLVESCSIEYLIKYSNLKILGEADCAVSEDSGKISNNMNRQLVDTY